MQILSENIRLPDQRSENFQIGDLTRAAQEFGSF
jgi:hypothetical protein